jgi:hypothetical protein
MRKVYIVALAIVVAWLALFLSSRGVLVSSERVPSAQQGGQDTLRCTYFIATGFQAYEYWYSPNDIMGRSVCPRLRSFAE